MGQCNLGTNLRPRGGDESFQAGCIPAPAFFHEAAERERPPRPRTASNVPKNLPSGVPNGLHGTRNGTPKPDKNRPLVTPVFEARKEASPKPLLPWGLASETRPNLTTFEEAFVTFLSGGPRHLESAIWQARLAAQRLLYLQGTPTP